MLTRSPQEAREELHELHADMVFVGVLMTLACIGGTLMLPGHGWAVKLLLIGIALIPVPQIFAVVRKTVWIAVLSHDELTGTWAAKHSDCRDIAIACYLVLLGSICVADVTYMWGSLATMALSIGVTYIGLTGPMRKLANS